MQKLDLYSSSLRDAELPITEKRGIQRGVSGNSVCFSRTAAQAPGQQKKQQVLGNWASLEGCCANEGTSSLKKTLLFAQTYSEDDSWHPAILNCFHVRLPPPEQLELVVAEEVALDKQQQLAAKHLWESEASPSQVALAAQPVRPRFRQFGKPMKSSITASKSCAYENCCFRKLCMEAPDTARAAASMPSAAPRLPSLVANLTGAAAKLPAAADSSFSRVSWPSCGASVDHPATAVHIASPLPQNALFSATGPSSSVAHRRRHVSPSTVSVGIATASFPSENAATQLATVCHRASTGLPMRCESLKFSHPAAAAGALTVAPAAAGPTGFAESAAPARTPRSSQMPGIKHALSRLLPGKSVITRRQRVAAALAEVVRVEDSSDEEAPYAPQGRVAMNSGTVSKGCQATMEKPCLGPSAPQHGSEVSIHQAPTGCLVLTAALVDASGHCCVLHGATVLRTTAECKEWSQQQQQHRTASSAAGTPEAAGAVAALASGAGRDELAESAVLVFQVHDKERLVSLDLWSPEVSVSFLQCSECGDTERPSSSLGDRSGKGSFCNLLRFACRSVCGLKVLTLRAPSRSAFSRRSSTGSGDRCRSSNRKSTDALRRGKVTGKNSNIFRNQRTKQIKSSNCESARSCASQPPAGSFSGSLPSREAAADAVPGAPAHVLERCTPSSLAGFEKNVEVIAAEATEAQKACSLPATCAQPSEVEASRKSGKVQSSKDSHEHSGRRRRDSGKSRSRDSRSHKRNGGGDVPRDRCVSSKEKLITKLPSFANSSWPCTELPRTLNVPTSHRKQRPRNTFIPRNALLVTDGKPARGIFPREEVVLNATVGVATLHDHTTSKKRKFEDSVKKQTGSQDRRINKPHTSTAMGKTEEPKEILTSLADNAKKQSSRKGTRRNKGAGKHRSSKKLSDDDAARSTSVCSNSWCKETSRDETLGTSPAVSILCIELQATNVGELKFSEMLWKSLKGNSKVLSSAALSNGLERPTAGDAQVASPKSSSAPPDRQPVTAQENQCKYVASVEVTSSTTSAIDISGREGRQHHHRSKERLETEGYTKKKQPCSGRRHHTAKSSRRSFNPSSSRTSRRSQSGAPSPPVPASSDWREPRDLVTYKNATTVPQEKLIDNSTSCKLAISFVSQSIGATADERAEKRRVYAQPRIGAGNASGAFPVSSAPVTGLTDSEVTAPQSKLRKENEPSQGSFPLSRRKGLWLLLRFGPVLNWASSPDEADVTASGKTHQTFSFPLPGSLHRAGSSGSTNSQLGGQDDAALRQFKQEPFDYVPPFPSFIGAFTHLPLTFWPGEGKSAGVSAAARFFTNFTEGLTVEGKSSNATSISTQEYGLKKVTYRIEQVFQCLVSQVSGPWAGVSERGDATRNLSLGRLRFLWKASVGGFQRMGSISKPPSEALSPLRPAASPPITNDEGAKATPANASRAPTAATPICDVLLDDKTLRRLSDKDFLDDTIIDFGLRFIFDHVLSPTDRLRVHISNTFFLPALMGEQSEEVAHSRLTRWLKKEVTPLPNKDIIFIPIHHQHQHWSLAVVVYPWRAVNFSVRQPEGAVAHAVAGPASQLIGKQLPLGTLQAHGLKAAPCQPVLAKAFVDSPSVASIPRCAAARCLKAKWTPPLCPTKPNFHLRKDSHSKARMFHVDSMGLRAEFDRCRGRLKRFLQRVRKRHKPTSESSAFGASCILEFEFRCRGTLESGERAEFCTESCCWQDGLSCSLHTPRQKNGYDCGVFVLEFVLFLTRNLEAIETLLDGHTHYPPIRQRRRLLGASPGPTVFEDSPGSFEGRTGDEVCSAHNNNGELLRAALGFSCPCMAAKGPMTAPCGAAMWSVFLKEQATSRLPPADGPEGESARHVCPLARGPGKLPCRLPFGPQAAHSSQDRMASVRTLPQGDAEGQQRVSSVEALLRTASGGASCPSSPRVSACEATSNCPIWGPLRASTSTRHNAHTKWFSQARVTQRRSQLHQMLLFMRENTRWQEHPQQIAHLRSLLLDVEEVV